MKNLVLMFAILLAGTMLNAQPAAFYNPGADAKAEIKQAIEKAKSEKKHVFLQIGGNWCPWCVKFHRFINDDQEINNFVRDHFVVVKINHSKENRNLTVLSELDYPQRFGFPVFVILDGEGNRIHTQNSAYLEESDGYSKEKVLRFFNQWTPAAVDPASYTK
ncbi:MAG: thioredoxin family protein [Prolixibacteraceae bacterium]